MAKSPIAPAPIHNARNVNGGISLSATFMVAQLKPQMSVISITGIRLERDCAGADIG